MRISVCADVEIPTFTVVASRKWQGIGKFGTKTNRAREIDVVVVVYESQKPYRRRAIGAPMIQGHYMILKCEDGRGGDRGFIVALIGARGNE